ncbi:MAG TPA: GNAT family N-acetyltransferase [Candidatus Limnocylindria bacterium]|nr:GNAT family N-acetyltransferase [Candidatus Limnocylindria bacterium]
MRIADLDARPATIDDAARVADLLALVDPEDPADPEVLRYQWKTAPPWPRERFVLEKDGRTVGFAFHSHAPWEKMPDRFGFVGVAFAPDELTAARVGAAFDLVEERSRADGTRTFSTWARDKEKDLIGVLLGRGYTEDRRGKGWELDLVAERGRLESMAADSRARMEREGIRIRTLAEDGDPEVERKLWAVWDESRQDIPTTVPHPPYPFEQWRKWLSKPGILRDRLWIAREGDDVVGVSALMYPPTRGNVWTDYTGTARKVRGRGVARALKLETVMQAIALGVPRVRTGNDGANAPILHLNEEMGYKQFGSGIQFLKQA